MFQNVSKYSKTVKKKRFNKTCLFWNTFFYRPCPAHDLHILQRSKKSGFGTFSQRLRIRHFFKESLKNSREGSYYIKFTLLNYFRCSTISLKCFYIIFDFRLEKWQYNIEIYTQNKNCVFPNSMNISLNMATYLII